MIIKRQSYRRAPLGVGSLGRQAACLFFIVCFAITRPCFAISLETGPNQWILEHWQTENGLPQNSAHCIVRDKDGFLWIGTDDGLTKFDGASFQVYNRFSNPPLPSEYVYRLICAEDGVMWVGTRGGGVYYRKPDANAPFVKIERLLDENVWAMTQDLTGSIWVSGKQGINIISNDKATEFQFNAELRSKFVTALFAAKDGSVWIGTDKSDIYRFKDGKLQVFPKESFIIGGEVRAFCASPSGGVWIGTKGDGLLHLKDDVFTAFDLLPENPVENVHALFYDKAGSLWVGFQHDGMARIVGETIHRIDAEKGLTSNFVVDFMEDDDGSIWLGTQFGGLNRVREGRFRSYGKKDGLPDENITCILPDKDNRLWIGSMDKGMFFKNGASYSTIVLGDYAKNHVRALAMAPNGDLWIGTAGAGLAHYDHEKTTFLASKEGLPNLEVTALLTVGQNLWIGMRGALARLNFETGELKTMGPKDLLHNDFVRAFALDRNGKLWFGTQAGALFRYDGSSFTQIMGRSVDGNLSFRSLYFDAEENLWAGTRETGLMLLRPGFQPFFFKTESGLNGNAVFDVFEDQQGLFWFSGSLGVQRVKKSELIDHAEGRLRVVNAHLYNERDGIRITEFNSGYNPSAAKDKLGNLWFATKKGLLVTNPDRNQVNTSEPRVFIKTITADGEIFPIQNDKQVFAPGTRNLNFSYTAPLFKIPSRVAFQYKLEGVDAAWSAPVHRREVAYHNLDPGSYRFLVKARNEEGIWSSVPAVVPFTVKPFFYQTLWFYILGGALAITLARAGYLLRVRSLLQRKKELVAEVKLRTAAVEDANSKLKNEVLERRKAAERLGVYSQLGQKLHSVNTQETAAKIILQTASKFFHFESGFIEIYEANRNKLRRIADTSAGDNDVGQQPERAPGFMEMEVMREGGRVLQDDLSPRLSTASNARPAPSGSTMCVPIRNAQRIIGIICLQVGSAEECAPELLQTLQSLADYCAGALDRLHASQALEESERRFLAFMTNTPALAWMKNSKFEYAYASGPFAELFKMESGSLLGKTDFDLFSREAAVGMRRNDEMVLRTGRTIEVYEEVPSFRGGISTFWVFKFQFVDSSGEKFVGGMGVDVTEKKKAEEALRALPYDIIQAQEGERRRVARELHDSVSQVLSSIRFRLHTAESQMLNKDRDWLESYGKAKQLLDSASQQVRQISRNLRPGELDDFGLFAALRQAALEFQERTGINVKVELEELGFRLNAATELNLYRIFQEALNNVEKYSKATTLLLQTHIRNRRLIFQVSDNGCGFSLDSNAAFPKKGGLGLRHMQERAGFIGGEFTLKTAPGEGVVIRVEAPIPVPVELDVKQNHENYPLVG
ncbi:MAG: two-component regulator propeller domain-containing protein [Verrucomicrobiales bacterium]